MREFLLFLADDPETAIALVLFLASLASVANAFLRRVAPNVATAISAFIPGDVVEAWQALRRALQGALERRRSMRPAPRLPGPPPVPDFDPEGDRPTPTPVNVDAPIERAPIRPKTWPGGPPR